MLASATSREAIELRRRFDDDEEEFEGGFDLADEEAEDVEGDVEDREDDEDDLEELDEDFENIDDFDEDEDR